jgi:hypothetical protein
MHGMIYSKYMWQKYLGTWELVAGAHTKIILYMSTNKNLKIVMQLKMGDV